jgi:hypothetical protein
MDEQLEPQVATPEAPAAPQSEQEKGRAEVDASFAAAFAELDPGAETDGDDAPAERDEPRAEGAPAEKDEAAPASDEEYEKALLALRYSGVPSAAIKNASRDELIAWGTEAAARRAKTEAALEERAKRIRELEEGQKAPAEPAKKPATVDWSPHLKALGEKLGLTPEEMTEAFAPALDAVAQQVRSEFDGRFSTHEKTLQEARAAEGRRQISEQVRRLADPYPKLKSDEALVEKLNSKVIALWKSGEYQDAESVYDDAAKLVLGAPTKDLSAKRRNGASAPPEGRTDLEDGSEDPFMAALDRVEAGDLRGARRVGSKMSWGPPERRRTH